MHWSRALMVLAALVGLAALPLPHLRGGATGAVDGFTGDSWPAVVVLGVLALLALLGDRAEGFPPLRVLVAVLLAGLAVVLVAVKVADASQAADVAGGSIGYGVWVLGGAALVGVAGALGSISRKLG